MAKQMGWFKTADRDGDRTLEQQLVGLEVLVGTVNGKTVLDVGCAEGLLDLKLAENGAKVHGIEIVPGHVAYAKQHAVEGVTYEVADATAYKPAADTYDYVLLLAILHKLKDPTTVAVKYARIARLGCVVRLPPTGAVIRDSRSGNRPHDITAAMEVAGLKLELEERGTFDEWIGYYERPAAAAAPAPDFEKTAPVSHESVPDHLELDLRERPVLTEADAAADLAGTPRPDNPSAEATALQQADQTRANAETPAPAEMAPPPNSVHPGGDPAVQLPIEKMNMPPIEGHRTRPPGSDAGSLRRDRAPDDTNGQ